MNLLFIGVLSSIGLPQSLRETLEESFGELDIVTEPFLFDFTDYYEEEMGRPIERFFISFRRLVNGDELALIKSRTNEIENSYRENGRRRINLDPGLCSEHNIILPTTKERAHRIPIGRGLFAEVTLIFHKKGWESFNWTYSDYRSERVQSTMTLFRNRYLEIRRKLN